MLYCRSSNLAAVFIAPGFSPPLPSLVHLWSLVAFAFCITLVRFGLKTTFIDEGTFKARVLADDEEFPAEDVVDISKIPVPVSTSSSSCSSLSFSSFPFSSPSSSSSSSCS